MEKARLSGHVSEMRPSSVRYALTTALRPMQRSSREELSDTLRELLHLEDLDVCWHVEAKPSAWPHLPLQDFAPLRQAELPKLLEAGFGSILERMESLSNEMQALQQRLADVEQAFAAQPRCRQAALYDLGSERYELRQPLGVQLEEYEEEAVARIPELDVFASADTDSEALGLLKREVVTLYEELAATPVERLGERPLAWLRLLERVIQVAEPA